MITLVERSSRFVLLAPLPGRHTAEIARMSLAEMIATLPLELRKSITWAPTRTPTVSCASTGPRDPIYAH